jgi:cyanate lyase
MLSLLKWWKEIAMVSLFVLVSGSMYYLHEKNISLEVANADLDMRLALSNDAVTALEEDRARVGRVVQRNEQEKAVLSAKLGVTQRELRGLIDASVDECLDRSIPADILDRL